MPWWNIADAVTRVLQPLVVPMGDPAGIGPEIIGKAWAARQAEALPPFVAIGDVRAVQRVWSGPVQRVDSLDEVGDVFGAALPVLQIDNAGGVQPGAPDIEGARCALTSLELAVDLVREGVAGALVTGPVGKSQLYAAGFTHPGQTEFVAERCGVPGASAVMMLAGPSLRVVPLTVHIPLAQVPAALTRDLILAKARVTARGLSRSFGIGAPRLAFAGLNPHAGEQGALGREEIEVIEPAIAQLRLEGIDAAGPFAADTLFHARARQNYDVVLCPYHDQALVPLKTLDFDQGVNVTLGLPIVRTSPDHGTAFGIAGKDLAHPGAMIAAIRMASEMAVRRSRQGASG